MNVYVTKLNGTDSKEISQYKQWMIAEIAHQLGFREMGIYRYDGRTESADSLNGRLDGIIAGIQWGKDVVVCQFPTGNGFKFEWELVNRLKFYRSRVVIFNHDPGVIVRESSLVAQTIRLYNQAEVLIVPSLAMRQFLLDSGIRKDMRFVIQEMWDCTTDRYYFGLPQFRREIHFIGSDGLDGISEWNHALPLKQYADSSVQGKYEYQIEKVTCELSKGGFGLVWYQDSDSRQEMEYGVSFNLARYLVAGIPVIAPAGISNQTLIEKNHLGLIVNSLDEAAVSVETMSESEYQGYIQAVRQFAPALRNGYYMKKCLVDAVLAVYREDAGSISASTVEYDLEEYVFTYIVLKESYEGNLALSWNYRGKVDGFLIYDMDGKLIYETRNMYQHYFLIKGYEKENGFKVKAYVDTLRGKIVVAESEITYLCKTKYGQPKVSLIIPAYNAADCIVRSIDTALAQSFLDLEIIIIDDGSTDGTSDIIDWYAEKYSSVKAIHQENGGPARARNTGIRYATGEYIEFLDSDDMLCPDLVTGLYHSAIANGCDIVVSSVYMIKNNQYKIWIQYPIKDLVISVEKFFEIHFSRGWILNGVVWNKLYRSSLVKEHLFPEIFSEDEAWMPYILSYADKIGSYGDGFYEYDRSIREYTLVNQVLGRSKEEVFITIKKAVIFYLKNGNPDKMPFLRQHTKMLLLTLKIVYSYDQYEILWHQLEESFKTRQKVEWHNW